MTVVINGTSGITDVNGTAAAPAITGTDTDTGVFFGTNTVSLSTGGTERLQVDSSGNLGLGVTPSAWTSIKALQVVNASFGGLGGGNYSAANAYYDGANWKYITSNYATLYQQSGNAGDGVHKWNIAASGTAGNAISFTQAMTLDASGNLIVNGTSPVGKLTVSGQSTDANNVLTGANITAGTQLCLRERGNSAGISGLSYVEQIYSGPSGGAIELYTVASYPVVFGTAATERARIDSSGNFFINRTATGSGNGFSFAPNLNGTNIPLFDIRGNSDSNSHTIIQAYRNSSSTYAFYIQWNGQIYAQVTSISSASDASLKENIRPLETGLSQIMALQPRRFDWIDGRAQNVAGFVAQEVQPVLPDLVDSQKYSENDDGTTEYKLGIRMSDMIPTMVKAIQEQQAIITQLQADVAALKGKA